MVDAAFEVSDGVVSPLLGEREELVIASASAFVFVATVLLNPLELSMGSEEPENEQDIIGKLNHLA